MTQDVAGEAPSLLARLLTVIVGPLILLAVLLAVGSGVLIHSLTQRTSDRVLLGSLTAIAETLAIEDGEITLDLPPAAFGMLEDSERDNVYYSVRYGDVLLSGYRDLPFPETSTLAIGEPQVRNARFRGMTVRVAAVAKRIPRVTEPVVVQVAETMKARNKLQLRLAAVLAALVGLLVVGAAFLVPPAVAWGLRPLDQLRREVEGRWLSGPVDLSPLSIERTPREVRPFVGAFNALLHQLENSTAAMRRFTSDASHQMRTPLAALRTHLALARHGSPTPAEARAALGEVDAAAGRLERLLAQLLSLARAEEQGQGLTFTPVDLARLAAEITGERAPQAVAAGVDISLEDEAHGQILALAEPFLLGEILANLVDNAVGYNHPGGRVVVRVRHVEGRPILEVEDDGPGVPAGQRAEVFERFARLTRDRAQPGTGLGLAIVQTLARRLEARVTMQDARRFASGLLVTVTLRAVPEPGVLAAS